MAIIFGLVCKCKILTTASDRPIEGSATKSAPTSKCLKFMSLLNWRDVDCECRASNVRVGRNAFFLFCFLETRALVAAYLSTASTKLNFTVTAQPLQPKCSW